MIQFYNLKVDQNDINHATINFGKLVDQNRNDINVTYLTSFNYFTGSEIRREKNIFDPLDMNETKFTVPFNSEHRLMTTYEFDQENSKLHGQKIEPQKIGNYNM